MKYNPYTQESIKASLYPLETARQSVFFLKISKEIGKAWRKSLQRLSPVSLSVFSLVPDILFDILGDPGADSGGEGKSKQAEKYGTKEK